MIMMFRKLPNLQDFLKMVRQEKEVHDLTEMCDVWAKNDGCRLDQDFYVNNQTQGFTGFVKSHDMFSFMQKTCMKSCGWAPEGKHTNY